jgi:hypothetical protein
VPKVGSDGGGVPAILNDSDDGGQLALDLDECPLNGKALALSRNGEIAHLGVEGVDEGRDQFGRHQSLFEPTQDAVFKFMAPYQQCVRADTF